MSKDNVTRRISIFVNGKEVENSLKGVEGAISHVRNKMRLLNTDSETYDQDSKELAKTMTQLREKQEQYRQELGLTNKTMQEANEISGGLRGTLSGIWSSLVTGDLQGAKEGISSITSGIGGLIKASWAFIATPIGAAIAALAGIGAGAKAVFDYNEGLVKMNEELRALGVNASEISKVRSEISATAEAFDKDFKEIAEKANSLSKTYGISMSEANEVIAKGLADGGAQNNEFLDSLGEYDEFFVKAGYSAKEFADIINTGYDLGIYSDKLPDALKEADLALKEQTKASRDALVNAFGQSFSDEILNKVRTGEMTTKQALENIAAKAKETQLSQQQQAQLTADIFKGAGEDAGGAMKIFEALEQSRQREMSETAKSVDELREANERLNKAQAELFEVENFSGIWNTIKTAVVDGITVALNYLNMLKTSFKVMFNVVQNTFINIKNTIISSFVNIIERVAPILNALGVDVEKLQKKLEGFKSKNVELNLSTKTDTSNEKNASQEIIKINEEEAKRLAKIKEEARKKEQEERQKAAEKRKADEEKAAKEEYSRAKALADAKANLAKAQLDKYIFDLRSNLDKEKALTPESIAAETDRLAKIKDAQIKANNEELARKVADLEAKAVLEKTSQEVLNAEKEALNIEYLLKNQGLELDFQQQTDALKKQYEEEQKILKAEQLALDNELALMEAETKAEEDKLKQEQEYQEELRRYAKLHADKKITDEEYTRFKNAAAKRQEELDSVREIQQLQGTLGGLNQLANAVGEMFGQSKELAIIQAGINGAMAVTSILAQYPKFDGGFAMWAAIAAAGITTMAQVGKIAAAKPPKKPKFFFGGSTGTTAALGYDEFGPVTGYVHQNEYVIPEVMTQDPRFANTINWLEANRQQKLRGFVDGGSTSSTTASSSDAPLNNEAQMITVLDRLTTVLSSGIFAKLILGYQDVSEIEKMKNELKSSSDNGKIG